MQLHWSPKSPYVRKVMIAAHELGAVEQLELVRSVAAMLKPNPALMAVNPMSKIPALVLDGGGTLFDSAVICEYLDTRYGPRLFPQGGSARWQALRWHAMGDAVLDALILWRNERERASPLQPLMAAFELKVHAALDWMEAEVPPLREAPFGIGHLCLVCALGYMDYRFDTLGWRGRAPQLAAWFADMQQRPSVLATEPVEG